MGFVKKFAMETGVQCLVFSGLWLAWSIVALNVPQLSGVDDAQPKNQAEVFAARVAAQ